MKSLQLLWRGGRLAFFMIVGWLALQAPVLRKTTTRLPPAMW